MTDVKISPNAAAIHVEGDIGGGTPSVIKIASSDNTLITSYADILAMYNNCIMPTIAAVNDDGHVVHLYRCNKFEEWLFPDSYFTIEASESVYNKTEEPFVNVASVYIVVHPNEATVTYNYYYYSATDDE
jgi:hypothetical protein